MASAMETLAAMPGAIVYPPEALRFARFAELPHRGCVTVFDGLEPVYGEPHYGDHHYRVISHRCGYGDDVLRYCIEHEYAHSFLAEHLHGRPSRVLTDLAAGKEIRPGVAAEEECITQVFQRWLRANERPIVGGVDWDGLKAMALRYLGPVPQ